MSKPTLVLFFIAAINAHIYNQFQQYPNYFSPIAPTWQNNVPNIFGTFQLPRQVRVPGKIEIVVGGGDTAEIYCEFPRFLVVVQVRRGIFVIYRMTNLE